MVSALVDESPRTQKRRPRFKRSDPPPFRLTADDLTIIGHVGEHRFLRSTHLVQLLNRPADKISRRLGALYHHGYLDRPRAQLDVFARAGSAPLVYALGNKGAARFAEFEGVHAPSVDWTDKNRNATRPYIEHALLIADFMVALECAIRDRSSIRLLRARDIAAANPWTMTATVPGEDDDFAVTPDKVFGLSFSDTGRRNYFCVEADRSTMPIERRSLAQSSFKKKLLTYYHGHEAKRHVSLWGVPGFRVLTLAKSTDRIVSMIKVLKDITSGKGSNVFLFLDANTIAGSDLLDIEWHSGKSKLTRLIA